ncbi:MAG: cytochrome b [Beijerinckiaceae bacterium]
MSTPDSHLVHQLDAHADALTGPVRIHLPVAKFLHWALAVVVVMLVTSGIVMKQLGEGPVSDQLYTLHKTAGATALLLIVLRIVYRLAASIAGRWRSGAGSQAIHYILYVAMLLVPLLGWAGVSDFGARGIVFGYSLPMIWPEGAGYADRLFAAHAYLSFGLLALVAVHIGVAIEDYVMRGRAAARLARDA